MAKPKKAHELTTHEAIHRLFGPDAAKELRRLLRIEDRMHGRKPQKRKKKAST